MKALFIVQEFAGGKWWNLRSFDTSAEATAFKSKLGHKTRVIRRREKITRYHKGG